MAKKDSFFSRLFRGGQEKVEPEAAKEPEVQKAVQEKVPAAAASKATGSTAPAAPPLKDVALLELPPEHAMHRLWNLRLEQGGWMPSPKLLMMGPEDQPQPLTAEDAERELPRLRLAVTTSANQRISKALPKKEDDPQPNMDAQPVIFLTRDMLSAWVVVYPPVGSGGEVNKDILERALRESQVSFGVDAGMLEKLPRDDNRYFHLFLIARGQAAVNGRDGGIVDLFNREIKREVVVDEFDQVDYSSLNLVQNVEEGEAICRIVPSLAGTPGTTVTGKTIPAKDGRPAVVPKGRNTELTEDGERLIATCSGHVEFTGRAFQVKPVLEVPGDVDFSTGNINFLGDVHVHGDVTSGFSVKAMGNIIVDGLVEAANVDAGGDLVMAKGVVGNGQAVIMAQRNVFAKFLENCCVRVRENLQADCIINCDVYSDGVVQVRSGRGAIIGGRIRAAYEVSASVVGSKSERVTAIDLGGLPCEDYEREKLLQELRELREELDKTELQPSSPARASRLSTLRMKMSVTKMKMEQFDKDMELISQQMGDDDDRRLVCGIAYPGTVLTIGEVSLRLEYETRQCTAILASGEICLM